MSDGEQEQFRQDVTISGERYIRMPVKLLYVFIAGLLTASWAYYDLRTVGNANALTLAAVVADINTLKTDVNAMKHTQAIQTQKSDDFIDSTERMFNRYFRDYNDPDNRRTLQR